MTRGLTELAHVEVVHVQVVGHAAVPRVVGVGDENGVRRVSAVCPPGGWGLRALTRAVAPHVPSGMPLLAHAPVPAGVLACQSGQPYAVVVHGIDVYGAHQRRGTRPIAKVACDVLKGAAAVVTVSDRVRRALPATVASRAHVIHNGVDLNVFHHRGRRQFRDRPRLLSVGNLGRGKGHHVVLEALPDLIEGHARLHWEVIGEGSLRKSLERGVRRLGLENAVTFTGSLAPPEVAERMRAADVFVLPATYEALGCVFLEAMACGLPVVAACGEGIGEVIRHGIDGLLVEPTPAVVGAAVDELLASAVRAIDMGEEAARRATEFDWRSRAVELWDVVQEMSQ